MTGLLLPTLLAAIAGRALRGKSARFAGFKFAWSGLAIVAFGVELALYNPPIDSTPLAVTYGPWLWVATRIALLLAVARNAHARGAWSIPCLIAAVGIGLNTIVIVVNNGYMPQSATAATAVWGPEAASKIVDHGRLQNTRLIDADSRLTLLADVLPEPTWIPRPNVVSIGDVLLAMGIAGWTFSALRGVQPNGEGSNARPIADVEFREDVLHVRFNRLDRNKQLVGNRPI
jgi:Family of unknown function (DUF5317)